MVNLEDGTIRPFTRADMFTKNTNVMYEPGYEWPRWEKFLEEVTHGDQDLIDYLQMAAGYSLTGSVAEESFFIISGPTASGKSTYMDGLLSAMGTYTEITSAETFMKKFGQSADRAEIVKFAGARVVSTEELPEGERFDDALLKRVTGGSPLSARLLYQEAFSYMPQFKLWIATNHDPVTSDSAMFRRIKRVPFMHSLPEEKWDKTLKKSIKNPELGGKAVLAWAVKGAIKYIDAGKLETPMSVLMATSAYRQEQDSFAHFLNETFSVVEGNELKIAQVYENYSNWCKLANERPMKRPQMITKLRERHIEVIIHDDGGTFIRGLSIRADNFANPQAPFQR